MKHSITFSAEDIAPYFKEKGLLPLDARVIEVQSFTFVYEITQPVGSGEILSKNLIDFLQEKKFSEKISNLVLTIVSHEQAHFIEGFEKMKGSEKQKIMTSSDFRKTLTVKNLSDIEASDTLKYRWFGEKSLDVLQTILRSEGVPTESPILQKVRW